MIDRCKHMKVESNKEWLGDLPVFSNLCGYDEVYDEKIGLSQMHLHEFVEISIVVEGSGIHLSLDGASRCTVGDVYIINSGVPHMYFDEFKPRNLVVRNLLFNPTDIFSDEIASSGNLDYCYGVFKDNIFMSYMHLEPEKLKEVLYVVGKIVDETSGKQHRWQTSVKAYLTNLLIVFSRIAGTTDIEPSPTINERDRIMVSKAMFAVLSNYQDSNLTLESIAASVFVSKSYLSRIFKKATGKYFSEYIKEIRLNQACRLLRESDKTVEHIAHECGMKDLQSFYRLFKSTFSLTPNQYRRKLK